jgi:HEAT repeat protein
MAAAKQLLGLGDKGRALAAPTLASFIQDPHNRARRDAIRAAARLGAAGRDVATPLVTVFQTDDDELREEAARALRDIGSPAAEAIPGLQEAVERERLRWPRGRNLVNLMEAAIAAITAPEDARPGR